MGQLGALAALAMPSAIEKDAKLAVLAAMEL